MKRITAADFELMSEAGPFYGSEEASTLGLAPGEWPAQFEVEGLGLFTEHYVQPNGLGITYASPTGSHLFTIWND